MRMALSTMTVLGLVMLALAVQSISGLAPRLAAATPQRTAPPSQHLNEEVEYRFQGVRAPSRCLEPKREWKRL
jgi:hypothetical protein